MMSLFPNNPGLQAFSPAFNQPYTAPMQPFGPVPSMPGMGGPDALPMPLGNPAVPSGDTFSMSGQTETNPRQADLMFKEFSELTPQNVRSKGDIRGMVFDMDDTLSRFKLGHRDIPPELLAQLKNLQDSGIQLGVVTNNPSDETAKRFRQQLIDAGIHMEVITHAAKPHTQGLEMMREKFGLPPGQMMMVGDQPSDVQTGKRAGFKTAQVDWFGNSDLRKTAMREADKALAHVDSVKSIFDPTPDKPEFLPPPASASTSAETQAS